ncbi:MAG: sodium:solute symporter family protein [Desulfobacterales bacterium]|nr:sodium:solute symporter family protein [Desulfobacterales bacterium]MDJ0887679.1 sodium:solute symporter family protein [Desulfobacterales bacterium]
MTDYVVFTLVFAAIMIAALRSGRGVGTETDFALAGRSATSGDVAWIIIGTLVGGAATVGTVQMAYLYGFAAWHFTLGSGLACLALALVFSRALRESESITVAQFLGRHFGPRFRTYSSLIASGGMLMQIVAQFLAAVALIGAVFDLPPLAAVTVAALLTLGMIIGGGVAGVGLVGKLKCFLLYLIMLLGAGLALGRAGGWQALLAGAQSQGAPLSLFAYGLRPALVDLGSMVIGVLSTQIYLQAVFAAQTVRAARRGTLLSAALIPPLGLLGIIVGLYLRGRSPDLAADTARALPVFINQAFPSPVAALLLAGLLVIVLGTGAGLALGVTTNLYNDLLACMPWMRDRRGMALMRSCCALIVLLAAAIAWLSLHTPILQWSYVAMGLRGMAVFAGLCLATFFHGAPWMPALRPVLFALPVLYLAYIIWR